MKYVALGVVICGLIFLIWIMILVVEGKPAVVKIGEPLNLIIGDEDYTPNYYHIYMSLNGKPLISITGAGKVKLGSTFKPTKAELEAAETLSSYLTTASMALIQVESKP